MRALDTKTLTEALAPLTEALARIGARLAELTEVDPHGWSMVSYDYKRGHPQLDPMGHTVVVMECTSHGSLPGCGGLSQTKFEGKVNEEYCQRRIAAYNARKETATDANSPS